MQFSVDTKDLQQALSVASRFIEKKVTIPVLGTYLLTVSDGELIITATGLDYSARIAIPAIREPQTSSFCVDGRTFTAVISKLKDARLEFHVDEKNLTISRESGDIKLRVTDSKMYPEIVFGETFPVSFKSEEFAEICRGALLGTADHIEGTVAGNFNKIIQLNVERNLIEGKFTCYASDSHRLATITGLCDTEEKESFSLPIPTKSVRLIAGILNALGANLLIGQDEKHIFLKSENIEIAFRKLHATFPDLKAYLEKAVFDLSTKVSSADFRQSLELVEQVIDPRSMTANIGEIVEEVESEMEFDSFDTAFNISYILPLVRMMDGDIDLQFRRDEQKDRDGEVISLSYPMRVCSEAKNVRLTVDVQALR